MTQARTRPARTYPNLDDPARLEIATAFVRAERIAGNWRRWINQQQTFAAHPKIKPDTLLAPTTDTCIRAIHAAAHVAKQLDGRTVTYTGGELDLLMLEQMIGQLRPLVESLDDNTDPQEPPLMQVACDIDADEAFTESRRPASLRTAPDAMECHGCVLGWPGEPPLRAVVADGGVTTGADPTQMYKLSCGHVML